MMEFLSLCDVLFNVVSLAGYFCDVVFDVVLSYALFERGHYTYMAIVIALVIVSLVISQILSLRWYMHKIEMKSRDLVPSSNGRNGIDQKKSPMDGPNNTSSSTCASSACEPLSLQSKIERHCVIALHCCQLGVLWRYAKLFVPVDLRHVKHEVRDLCMLRLVHAFCEAAPMLLLQLYILVTIQKEEAELLKPEIPLQSLGSGHVAPVIVQQPSATQQHQLQTFKDLNIVSCTLSLFSVCWALASFSKNVRIQNVHRLVLTWLGVIFQFLWRLGTVISRVAALTVYASIYNHWIFMVITLHWISMFLWLISPKNVFHGERITRARKITLAALIAFVYIFAYINLQEVNHRQKMFIFYFVMFAENTLLVFLWIIGIWVDKPENWYMTPIWIFASFCAGLMFMFLYYRYFHVRRLGYEAGGRLPADVHTKYSCAADGTSCISFDDNLNTCQKYPTQIPGVFNCRFTNPVNGAARRKKKKPTTFVPPPNLNIDQPPLANALDNQIANTGLMSIPFWRRPVARSHTYGSENEGSAGSRVDIYQKLQEKKQKQLAELKIIEEEIKQGKLGGPVGNIKLPTDDENRASLPRQPIPHVKKHINIDPHEWRTSSPEYGGVGCLLNNLNVMPSPNLNNLNKYTRNYDPLYNNFALNTALSKQNFISLENNQRNMSSPISSQAAAAAENQPSLRQIVPRSKIPHNVPRNPFAESYRANFSNVFADNFNSSTELHHQDGASPSTRIASTSNSNNDDSNDSHTKSNNNINENEQKQSVAMPPPMPMPSQQQQRLHLQRQMQRAKTPEILLAPHYLDNSSVFYNWMGQEQPYHHPTTTTTTTAVGAATVGQKQMPTGCHIVANETLNNHNENVLDQNEYRIPSDIDSQVSLPRSYTLPREFKYYRRNKGRKFIKNERFIMSTNSSDGDVDSGDDNESGRCSNVSDSSQQQHQQQQRSVHCMRLQSPSKATASNHVSSARNQFPISISATTSPVTVSNIHGGASTSMPSSTPNNNNSRLNNLNLTNDATNNATNTTNPTGNCTRSASASPNIALNVPNYFNRIPNGHYLQQATARNRWNLNGSPSTIDCNMMNGTLDLINGVENTGAIAAAAALNRRLRLRGYGNQKNGMVRHETKL